MRGRVEDEDLSGDSGVVAIRTCQWRGKSRLARQRAALMSKIAGGTPDCSLAEALTFHNQEVPMAKRLRCRDMGMSGDFEATEMPPELAAKMKAAIRPV